jgi:hypothetical protein
MNSNEVYDPGSHTKIYSVRESSQTTLEALSSVRSWNHSLLVVILIFKLQSFDGVRRRCLPKFYKALEPGTEDDRMKGALWTLNVPVFGMSFFEFMQTLSYPT